MELAVPLIASPVGGEGERRGGEDAEAEEEEAFVVVVIALWDKTRSF